MAVVEGIGLAAGLGSASGRTPTLAVGLAVGTSVGAGYSTAGPVVWVSVSRVIGSVALLSGLYADSARITVSRVIGSVKLLGGSTIGARASVSRVIGKVRIRGTSFASAWTTAGLDGTVATSSSLPSGAAVGDAWLAVDTNEVWVSDGAENWTNTGTYEGLPVPTKDGYEYSTNPMLSRTEFESGVIRQRRRGDANYKPASATVMVTGAQLVTLEGVLASVGVEWWNLPMITGDSAGAVALHTVRVTGPLSYSMIEYDLFKASFELELQ